MAQLSKGSLAKVKAMDGFADPIVLQVSSLQQKDDTNGPPASPSSVAPTISKRTKGFARIDQLHPYDDQWCIKAKLSRKYPLRTITARGGTRAVCTVELVDSEGHSIQGTFWGPQAERCSVTLDEGKVYVVERFT
ncbi:uncharacterized protein HaLaN_15164, partial [Haematococcus lacustris]